MKKNIFFVAVFLIVLRIILVYKDIKNTHNVVMKVGTDNIKSSVAISIFDIDGDGKPDISIKKSGGNITKSPPSEEEKKFFNNKK